MTRTTHYALNPALTAIAAVLALSSTPLLAQEAQPATSTQATPTTTEPAPTPEATPTTPETTTTTTTDPSSTNATPVAKTTTTKSVKRATRTAAAKPVTTRLATTRTVVHATTPAPVPPEPATPATNPPPAPNSQSAVSPVVDMTSSTPAKPVPVEKSNDSTTELLEVGAGALALIALGGIAVSTMRRRRDARAWHGDWVDESATDEATPSAVEPSHDAVSYDEENGVVAPSAFAWGATAPKHEEVSRSSDDDRLPGETWVQRAYRGPSANNPSVSLKNRLRRAAFFDKRERDVAAGLAEPVDPDAGLPDRMTDQTEREFA